MAFEQLARYIDELAGEYERTATPAYLYALALYHDTALKHAKFKSQRLHAKETIKRLNRPFYEGYFNVKTKNQ